MHFPAAIWSILDIFAHFSDVLVIAIAFVSSRCTGWTDSQLHTWILRPKTVFFICQLFVTDYNKPPCGHKVACCDAFKTKANMKTFFQRLSKVVGWQKDTFRQPNAGVLRRHSPQCSAILRNSSQFSACSCPQFSAMLRNSPQCSAILRTSPHFSAILRNSPQFSTILLLIWCLTQKSNTNIYIYIYIYRPFWRPWRSWKSVIAHVLQRTCRRIVEIIRM